MSNVTFCAIFTKTGGTPATGLTLADIDLYLTTINRSTGVIAIVWDGSQNPTAEVTNTGSYIRILDIDSTLYDYVFMAQYTGITVLDTNYVSGAVGGVLSNLIQIAGATVNAALAQVGVNVVSQDNIDFGALQKTSLNAATPASVVGSVGSVAGNVAGKVLGGGVGVITGVGAWVLDGAGATIASAVDVVLTAAHGVGSWVTIPAATIAAAVWTYVTRTLTQTAASVVATISGSDVTITRGDTFVATLTGLASDVSDNDKIWFSFKRIKSDADTAAVVMIDKATGLVYINGAAASTPANGSITTPTATSAVITLAAAETAKLAIESGFYDVQKLKGTTVSTLTSGSITVSADVTRATS